MLELACLHDNVRALTTEWLNLGTRCSAAVVLAAPSLSFKLTILNLKFLFRKFIRSGTVFIHRKFILLTAK